MAWWKRQIARVPAGLWPMLALFALLSLVTASSRGLILRRYFHDAFFLFDSEWRAARGEVPHVDFHSPVGQAFYWPFRLLGLFGDHDALTVIHANILVGAILIAMMAATLLRRLSPILLAVTTIGVLALTMAPRDVDFWIINYSYLAPYNRWPWPMIVVVALITLLPPSRPRPVIDGIVLGLLLALFYYIKITFLVGAVIIVIAALLLRQLRPGVALVAVLAALATAGLVELIWHNNAGYIADLRMALAGPAENRSLRLHNLLTRSIAALCYLFVVIGIFFVNRTERSIGAWLRADGRSMFIAGGVILVGLSITIQNNPRLEYGHGFAAMIIALELVRRSRASAASRAPMSAFSRRRTIALTAAGLLVPGLDVASMFTHAAESWTQRVCPMPVLAGTQGEYLLKTPNTIAQIAPGKPAPGCGEVRQPAFDAPPPDYPDPTIIDPIEMRKMDEAMFLLRREMRPGDVILSLDFANPYPFLFAGQPPRGALTWWDSSRTYSKQAHPDAGPLLGSTTLVLQVISHEEQQVYGHSLWTVYGKDVVRDFRPVAETPRLRLWRKRGSASP